MTAGKTGFGVIGAGLWGRVHAEIYADHPQARLAAVCDRDRGRAEEAARRYDGVHVYTDYEEMVGDPAVEAVAVVTPDFDHRGPIVAAARAGRAVITEKPLATTLEDAEAIAEAVRRAGVPLMVDFHSRWNPAVDAARRDIEAGRLGRIVSAYFRLNDTISVPTSMLSWAARSSILWFLGSHTVDTLRYLFGDEVERVYSVERAGVLRARGVDVPDLYQSILEFRTGIVATIENHWIAPDSNPMVNDIKVNILGDRGMINMDLTHHQMVERFLPEAADHPDCLVKPRVFGRPSGFACESIRDFVERLARGEAPRVGLEDGLAVTRVVLALLESAGKRQPVAVVY